MPSPAPSSFALTELQSHRTLPACQECALCSHGDSSELVVRERPVPQGRDRDGTVATEGTSMSVLRVLRNALPRLRPSTTLIVLVKRLLQLTALRL